MRNLKIEEENGFVRIVISYKWVDFKPKYENIFIGCILFRDEHSHGRKRKSLKLLYLNEDIH